MTHHAPFGDLVDEDVAGLQAHGKTRSAGGFDKFGCFSRDLAISGIYCCDLRPVPALTWRSRPRSMAVVPRFHWIARRQGRLSAMPRDVRGRAIKEPPCGTSRSFAAKAREAIASGKLPTAQPSRTYSYRSPAVTCAVCGDSVPCGQMEFELEFRASPALEGQSLRDALQRLNERPDVRRYHLHHRCFAAWEFERT